MYLGIDIGGTFIKYGLINDDYQIVKNWKKETKLFTTSDAFYDYLCEDLDLDQISHIGVSAPGVISENSTVLTKAAPNVRIMLNTNVNEEIKKRTGKIVATINDAKAAGYCEYKMGNGKGTKSSVYFIIGTGIGGCVCDEHGVIQGQDGIAGEFSNIPLGYQDGRIDCLSNYASMSALISLYNIQTLDPVQYGIEVCQRYLDGEELAVEVMDQWCENICLGLLNIIIFFNPEVICLGGGISMEDWFIEKVNETFKTMHLPFNKLTTTKITRCKFSNDSNLLGAVLFATKD